MPLNLHPGLAAKIRQDLITVLENVKLIGNFAIAPNSKPLFSDLDNALPGHGDLRRNLENWISDRPLSDFVVGYTNLELMGQPFEPEEKPLQSVAGWENAAERADMILNAFAALPNRYAITVRAPTGLESILENHHPTISISSNETVLVADENLQTELPLSTGDEGRDKAIWGNGLLGIEAPKEWKGCYIRIIREGFIGNYVETRTEHAAIDDIKAFIGYLFAQRLVKRRWSSNLGIAKTNLRVHVLDEQSNCRLLNRTEMDREASELFEDVVFDDWLTESMSANAKSAYVTGEIQNSKYIFGNHDGSERLRLACKWLFDSHSASNDLLGYVQAMVCLEIILGDASLIGEIGLGELLRNRLAYLIGKDASQRREILDEFREIYDVRSHIVHRGKSRISARERALYTTLRWYCTRAIQEEVKLLKAGDK